MVEVTIAFAAGCVAVLFTVCIRLLKSMERQREEWAAERASLLDRIQSGDFITFKAQERADIAPAQKKEKDPAAERLERLPWA